MMPVPPPPPSTSPRGRSSSNPSQQWSPSHAGSPSGGPPPPQPKGPPQREPPQSELEARKRMLQAELDDELKRLDADRKQNLYKLDWQLAEAVEALHEDHATQANDRIRKHQQVVAELERRAQVGQPINAADMQSFVAKQDDTLNAVNGRYVPDLKSPNGRSPPAAVKSPCSPPTGLFGRPGPCGPERKDGAESDSSSDSSGSEDSGLVGQVLSFFGGGNNERRRNGRNHRHRGKAARRSVPPPMVYTGPPGSEWLPGSGHPPEYVSPYGGPGSPMQMGRPSYIPGEYDMFPSPSLPNMGEWPPPNVYHSPHPLPELPSPSGNIYSASNGMHDPVDQYPPRLW